MDELGEELPGERRGGPERPGKRQGRREPESGRRVGPDILLAGFVEARLVNEPFSDPGVLLDVRFGRRAILFDLGDLAALSPREIGRVGDVFVSHLHMDHFAGFDRLLRLNLYGERQVRIVGPPGLVRGVEAKLAAYSWNLLGPRSADFSILALDWEDAGFGASALFRARDAFRRVDAPRPAPPPRLVLDEPEFTVEAAVLDHGIPCLGFALQERLRVNVHRARLDAMRLAPGPWLTEAKRAARAGLESGTRFEAGPGRTVSLGALREAGALQIGPGQRVAYVTDIAANASNLDAAARLAKGADLFFVEAGFLPEDEALARAKHHMTAADAGALARRAGVRRAVPFHFSARYLEREEDLRAAFDAAFRGHDEGAAPS